MSLRIPISLPFSPFSPFFQVYFLGFFFLAAPAELNSEFCWEIPKSLQDLLPGGGFIPNFVLFFGAFPSEFFFFCPNFPLGSHFQEVFESLLVPTLEFLGFSISGNENFAPSLGFFGNFAASPSPASTGESGLNLPQAFLGFFPSQKILENPI